MNHTIEQIVNAIFAGAAQTDEARALYQETLHNSQTLYQSLLERGVDGEEAMSAVADSLRGVELLVRHMPEAADDEPSEPAAPPDAIEALVSALFTRAEQTDEVHAMYEETLSNCRERYEDLLAGGMSREEAVGAVADSLRGMEELLNQYPRQEAPAEAAREEEESVNSWTFDPASAPIRVIELKLNEGCELVDIRPAADGLVRVEAEDMEYPLNVCMEGDKLMLSARENARENAREDARARREGGFGLSDLSRLMERFLHGGRAAGEVRVSIPAGLAPELHVTVTTGDVSVSDLTLAGVNVSATNGEITAVKLTTLADLRLNSTNGDIELTDVSARGGIIVSGTNGDTELKGECDTLALNTVNGDIEASVRAANVALHTVNGDAEVCVNGTAISSFSANTVTGDVSVRLPDIQRANIKTNTGSGDVDLRLIHDPDAEVRVRVSTVSGDIEIG